MARKSLKVTQQDLVNKNKDYIDLICKGYEILARKLKIDHFDINSLCDNLRQQERVRSVETNSIEDFKLTVSIDLRTPLSTIVVDIKEIVKSQKKDREIPELPKLMSIDEIDIYIKLVTGTKRKELIDHIMKKESISPEGAIQRIRRTKEKMNAFHSYMNKLGITPKE